MSAHFEIYQSEDGWRWRLRAANGEPVASGEGHTTKSDAFRAIGDVVAASRAAANEAIEVK